MVEFIFARSTSVGDVVNEEPGVDSAWTTFYTRQSIQFVAATFFCVRKFSHVEQRTDWWHTEAASSISDVRFDSLSWDVRPDDKSIVLC